MLTLHNRAGQRPGAPHLRRVVELPREPGRRRHHDLRAGERHGEGPRDIGAWAAAPTRCASRSTSTRGTPKSARGRPPFNGRVGFGSSAPRVTAPKVPLRRGRHRPGPRLRQRRKPQPVARPNAPGARWGKPPPRRPALAESLAPSSTRRAAAHAVSAVTGAAIGTGGVAEAIADLEWVVRGEAGGSSQPALVSPERLDVARRKPRATTFSKAGLVPVTHRAVTHRAVTVEEDSGRERTELPQYDERFGAVEKLREGWRSFPRASDGRDAGRGRVHVVVGRDGSELGLDDDADACVRTVRHPNLRGGAQTHPAEGEETHNRSGGGG